MMTAEIIDFVEYRKKIELRDELQRLTSENHISDEELTMLLEAMMEEEIFLVDSDNMTFLSDNYDLSTINYTVTFTPDDNLTFSTAEDDENDLEPYE